MNKIQKQAEVPSKISHFQPKTKICKKLSINNLYYYIYKNNQKQLPTLTFEKYKHSNP